MLLERIFLDTDLPCYNPGAHLPGCWPPLLRPLVIVRGSCFNSLQQLGKSRQSATQSAKPLQSLTQTDLTQQRRPPQSRNITCPPGSHSHTPDHYQQDPRSAIPSASPAYPGLAPTCNGRVFLAYRH